MSDAPILATHNLTIGYSQGRGRDAVIASDLNLSLHGGELVCLLGPNGAGKSTLLHTLSGMLPPLAGTVELGGGDVRALPSRDLAQLLSVVLTDRVSVGTLSVYALVALGRYPYTDWMGRLSAHDDEVIRWAIQAVGATALAERNVAELSDGERQKALIARALAQEPQAMLLDEPTAFLDLPHRVDVMRTLRSLARSTGQAIMLSTHDLDLALRGADHIWLMADDGTVVTGAPEDLVLSGAFQATFQREGVEFDAYTGSFTIEQRQSGVVHLSGEGIPALWTVRALEREGYCVDRNGNHCEFNIVIEGVNGGLRWHAETPDHQQEHDSIQSLLTHLRQAGEVQRR